MFSLKYSAIAVSCVTTLLATLTVLASDISPPDNDSNRNANEAAARAAAAAEARRGEYSPEFEIPKYEDTERVRALAETGRQRGQQAYQALIEKERQRLGVEEQTPIEQPVDGRIVIALSSSMPDSLIREYFQQLDGHREALVVLRGFVGGGTKVQPTLQWMDQTRRRDNSDPMKGHLDVETIVDPLLYRDLDIQHVPAVAYLPGVTQVAHCDDEDYEAAVVVYGATRVSYALEQARNRGAPIPLELIKRLEGSGWETSQTNQP